MKFGSVIALLLFAAMSVCAAVPGTPVWQIVDGNLKANNGPRTRVERQQGCRSENGYLVLNGNNSGVVLRMPWYDPNEPTSITLLADVIVDQLPQQRGVVVANPQGFGVLAVEPSGAVTFSCAGEVTKNLTVTSKTKVQPCQPYRLAGVINNHAGDTTTLQLYVNGILEAEETMRGAPVLADVHILRGYAGCSNFSKGKMIDPLACRLSQVRYYWKPFTKTEICLIPGKPEFVKVLTPFQSEFRHKLPVDANAKNAFTIPLKEPAKELSVELVFSVDKLPPKIGSFWLREGFDDGLVLTKEGFLYMVSWNAEGDQVAIRSQKPIVPGKQYRVIGRTEQLGVETVVSMAIDGVEQGKSGITGTLRRYPPCIHFGGLVKNGKVLRGGLEYRLYECKVYPIAVRANDIPLE